MSEATRDSGVRLGISSCLLGNRVRYDGGHKRDEFIVESLTPFVTFVTVCPEFELGLGVPRETLRLQASKDGVRLVAPKSGKDHTEAMNAYASKRARELHGDDLDGFILKKDSPSCGVFRVKLYDEKHGMPEKSGTGLFAANLSAAHPLLPIEEEGRLHDPALRESFFVRVFAGRRLRDLFRARWKLADLVRFHASEKMLLMAHDESQYRRLGRLVADSKARPRSEVQELYGRGFLQALAKPVSRRRHVNVLQHVAGHFKDVLDADGKAELVEVIDSYRKALVPLIVPLTLLQHHVRRHGSEWLRTQTYLDPHPRELMLRNHV